MKLPENELFYCRHILEVPDLEKELDSFIINRDSGGGLEKYLKDFAVNDGYKELHQEQEGIGLIVFTAFILPIVREVSRYVGVCLLYIFALPYKGLVEYYEKMNFKRLPIIDEYFLHRRMKPRYDSGCIFMSQKI